MEQSQKAAPRPSVHKVLAHSYLSIFVFFLLGVALDLVFNLKYFNTEKTAPLGFIFLFLGTFIILWAQKTSRNFKKEKDHITKESFCRGPYCFTRCPTHWGLFLLMLGFGMVANALFIVVISLFSFIFSKLTFLHKEEEILAARYGDPYLEYKKSVRI